MALSVACLRHCSFTATSLFDSSIATALSHSLLPMSALAVTPSLSSPTSGQSTAIAAAVAILSFSLSAECTKCVESGKHHCSQQHCLIFLHTHILSNLPHRHACLSLSPSHYPRVEHTCLCLRTLLRLQTPPTDGGKRAS